MIMDRDQLPEDVKVPQEVLSEEDRRYLNGTQNKLIRFYFYTERGLDILNIFRNLFLGILAIFVALKLTNVFWIAAMIVPSIMILVVVGYYNVHKLSKMKEWLGMRFSTHYGLRAFNYQEDQVKVLKEIRDLLRRIDNVKCEHGISTLIPNCYECHSPDAKK